MRLSRALDDKKLDTRLRDKLIYDGKVTSGEVDQYLNSLPDDAANAVYTDQIETKKPSNEETLG